MVSDINVVSCFPTEIHVGCFPTEIEVHRRLPSGVKLSITWDLHDVANICRQSFLCCSENTWNLLYLHGLPAVMPTMDMELIHGGLL